MNDYCSLYLNIRINSFYRIIFTFKDRSLKIVKLLGWYNMNRSCCSEFLQENFLYSSLRKRILNGKSINPSFVQSLISQFELRNLIIKSTIVLLSIYCTSHWIPFPYGLCDIIYFFTHSILLRFLSIFDFHNKNVFLVIQD